ncbi:hypothetical protein CVT26_008731 [Gymnopilus dilepis]|uniref:Uncharacterized protein n=1 Tax=Gymnopilus dilepis TaxID=231916 RepID=A0A409X8M3_9AGAR|nr:hypothetical protein CVT26_008731 [Gymnopilus dilepis]
MSPTNKNKKKKAKSTTTTVQDTFPTTASPLETPTATLNLSVETATAPTTAIAFRDFIELATLSQVKLFLATAYLLPEGQNLTLLWDRAFDEGIEAGKEEYRRRGDNVWERGHDAGYKQGFEEGERSVLNVYQLGQISGIKAEQEQWIKDGHGDHCFKSRPTCNSGIQTKPLASTTAGVGTSDDSPIVYGKDCSVQTEPTSSVISTISKPSHYQDFTIQTASQPFTSSSTQVSSPLTLPPLVSSASSPTTTTTSLPSPTLKPLSKPLNWADDVEATSFPLPPNKPPPRDLSILRSASPKPFASLQRRTKRSKSHFSQPFRHNPRFPAPRRSQLPLSRAHPQPSSALNWEDDPRLLELSRALKALGWVRSDPGPATRTSLFSRG